MTDKKAIVYLQQVLAKYPLDKDEKEAVLASIGLLSWTKLAENRIKTLKKKTR